MRQEMILLDESGNEIKCNIVASFKNDDNEYIAYTDGNFVNGKKELYVSKLVSQGDKMRIYDITDESEWNYVNDYLNKHFYNEGGEYE